ncbi:MAG: HPr family phosphocarrier protein [Clostridia bacterium]|nr:HPr family phosphocarrier protein [Clostridia bacterium]
MKIFTYTVNDENGIHARPAGVLVNAAKAFSSDVRIKKNGSGGGSGREVDGKRLFSVMSLGARHGEQLTFTVDGNDEELAAQTLERVCRDTLG